jgi:phosphotransferase system  glucose/maltose/N-acetylglucosamine-specific IIC component
MNPVPLVTLLIITAVLAQTIAFFVTFWIRRKSVVKDDREDDVPNFTDCKDQSEKDKISPGAEA